MRLPVLVLAASLLTVGVCRAAEEAALPPLLQIERTGSGGLAGAIEAAAIEVSAEETGEEIRIVLALHGGRLRIEAVMERGKPMSLLEVRATRAGSEEAGKKRLVDHAALLLLERQLEGRLDTGRETARILLTFVQFLTRRLPVGAPFPATVEVP